MTLEFPRHLTLSDGMAMECAVIPAGRFRMGSSRGLPLELPVHPVTIAHSFMMGRLPVTREQWDVVMGADPCGQDETRRQPVDNVSWDGAVAFCGKLSASSGRKVRLPSEAEWEYACRAGSDTEFYFGDLDSQLEDHAWFDLNSGGRVRAAGLKKPNAWGLHDMAGNVWEWCADVWHSDYEGAPDDGSPWMAEEDRQPRRSLRGGSWNFDSFRCRSAYRSREWRHFSTDHFGFRVVVEGGAAPP
jgi:formylglycine-generating enzyme required for sulfatase activity